MIQLFHWYMEEILSLRSGRQMYVLHGIVFGHGKQRDGTAIHTSEIQTIEFGAAKQGIYVAHTRNTAYPLRIQDCKTSAMQHFWETISDTAALPGWLQQWRERYDIDWERHGKIDWEVPQDGILLRLGNRGGEWLFDGMAVWDAGELQVLREANIHLGMFQDSVLCVLRTKDGNRLYDLRYFVALGETVEFYKWETYGLPVYVENSGTSVITVTGQSKDNLTYQFQLMPGERTKCQGRWGSAIQERVE